MSTTQKSMPAQGVSPIFLSFISTTIKWLIDEDELNRQVEAHLGEIRRLSGLSDRDLSRLGIRRDQITAYVLSQSNED